MASTVNASKMNELIARLDEAVKVQEEKGCCYAVKEVLEDIVRSGEEFVDHHFMAPAEGRYARRLVHVDPQNRYALMAMVWDVGQGTPLHDHAGKWCVECVYRGRIKVVSFDLADQQGDHYRFKQEGTIYAGVGEAGALIPPYDYHTIENASVDSPAVTLHVYGGEMNWCHAFVPEGDGFRRERRELTYTA
jgi:3-mercaptopropionate dioxygenase